MDQYFCTQCGTAMNAETVFCVQCGSKREPVDATEAPAKTLASVPAPEAADSPAPASAAPAPQADMSVDTVPPQAAPAPEAAAPVSAAAPATPAPATPVPAASAPVAVAEPFAPTAPLMRETPPLPIGPAKQKLWIRALTALLCLLLFLTTISFTSLYAVRSFLSEQTVKDVMNEIDVDALVKDFDVESVLLEHIRPGIRQDYNVRSRTITDFISDPAVREDVAEIVYGYIEAFMAGDADYAVSPDDIVDFLRDHEAAIRSSFGYRIEESDYDEIEAYLEEEKTLSDVTVGKMLGNAKMNAKPLLGALSFPLYVAAIFFGVLFLLLIFLLNRHRCRSAFFAAGLTFALSGGILSLFGLLLQSIVAAVAGDMPDILGELIGRVGTGVMLPGFCFLGTGLLMVAVFALIKVFARTKAPAA